MRMNNNSKIIAINISSNTNIPISPRSNNTISYPPWGPRTCKGYIMYRKGAVQGMLAAVVGWLCDYNNSMYHSTCIYSSHNPKYRKHTNTTKATRADRCESQKRISSSSTVHHTSMAHTMGSRVAVYTR